MSSPNLRRFVQDTLAATTGVATPSIVQVGAAFDVLRAALRRRLYPVFGAVACSALFARAVHVESAEFAWLADVLPDEADSCSVDALRGLDGVTDPLVVQAGLAAILARVIGLLSEFIGEDVVMPLVNEAWALPQRAHQAAKVEDL
jgi:hypothetical protein